MPTALETWADSVALLGAQQIAGTKTQAEVAAAIKLLPAPWSDLDDSNPALREQMSKLLLLWSATPEEYAAWANGDPDEVIISPAGQPDPGYYPITAPGGALTWIPSLQLLTADTAVDAAAAAASASSAAASATTASSQAGAASGSASAAAGSATAAAGSASAAAGSATAASGSASTATTKAAEASASAAAAAASEAAAEAAYAGVDSALDDAIAPPLRAHLAGAASALAFLGLIGGSSGGNAVMIPGRTVAELTESITERAQSVFRVANFIPRVTRDAIQAGTMAVSAQPDMSSYVQAAIDAAAAAGGGRVKLPNGYKLRLENTVYVRGTGASSSDTVTAGVILEGHGQNSGFIWYGSATGTPLVLGSSGAYRYLDVVAQDFALLTNTAMTGGAAIKLTRGRDVGVRRLKISTFFDIFTVGDSAYVDDVNNWTIEDITASGCGRYGFNIVSCTIGRVTRCTMDGGNSYGGALINVEDAALGVDGMCMWAGTYENWQTAFRLRSHGGNFHAWDNLVDRAVKASIQLRPSSGQRFWNTWIHHNHFSGKNNGETGTAQAGASGTITLASASAFTAAGANSPQGMICRIISGTGSGQEREISAFNPSTKVATMATNWSTAPNSTSVYAIFAQARGLDCDAGSGTLIQAEIAHNLFENHAGYGAYFNGAIKGVRFHHNSLRDVGWGYSEKAAIKAATTSAVDLTIEANPIYRSGDAIFPAFATAMANGIVADSASADLAILNHTDISGPTGDKIVLPSGLVLSEKIRGNEGWSRIERLGPFTLTAGNTGGSYVACSFGGQSSQYIYMQGPGRVVGIEAVAVDGFSAGTLDIRVAKNEASIAGAATAQLNTTDRRLRAVNASDASGVAFVASNRINAQYNGSAAIAPANGVCVYVWVAYD